MQWIKRFSFILLFCLVLFLARVMPWGEGSIQAQPSFQLPLWRLYQQSLQSAKYVDLTHTMTPSIPMWAGFGAAKFFPTVNPKTGKAYTYKTDGFEATHYDLPTDQSRV